MACRNVGTARNCPKNLEAEFIKSTFRKATPADALSLAELMNQAVKGIPGWFVVGKARAQRSESALSDLTPLFWNIRDSSRRCSGHASNIQS